MRVSAALEYLVMIQSAVPNVNACTGAGGRRQADDSMGNHRVVPRKE